MQQILHKPLKLIFVFLVLYLTVFLVISPSVCLSAAKDALNLCLDTIIPSFFPFFVCSGLLSALGFSRLCSIFLSPVIRPVFGLPGCSALAFFLGIVSGYPTGAVIAADLYQTGQCTRQEAERMTAFCNNSGPLFVIGVVGGCFLKSPALGKYLYIAHILSALLTGVLFKFYKGKGSAINTLPPAANLDKKTALLSLGGVIDTSVFSILKICGFVIFFAVAASTLPQNRFLPYIYSFIEITGGLNLLSSLDCDINLKLSLISFFLSFSGISVVFQVSSVLGPKGISLVPYVVGKLLQGIFSFFLIRIILRLFPISQDVFSPFLAFYRSGVSPFAQLIASIISALFALLVLGIFMLVASLWQNRKK